MKTTLISISSTIIICISLFEFARVEGLKCYRCSYAVTNSLGQMDCLQNPSAYLTDCNYVSGTPQCRAYKVKSSNGSVNYVERECVPANPLTGCKNETTHYGLGLGCYCSSEACNTAEMPVSKLSLAPLFIIGTFIFKIFV